MKATVAAAAPRPAPLSPLPASARRARQRRLVTLAAADPQEVQAEEQLRWVAAGGRSRQRGACWLAAEVASLQLTSAPGYLMRPLLCLSLPHCQAGAAH